MTAPLFHIVLLSPEIPNNTGNIGRTAMATGCRLHVVHPIGFSMDEKARRRAGLDYWKHVDCVEHASWPAFLETERPARAWLFSARAERSHWDAPFRPGDYMLFGRESTGVDPVLRAEVIERWGAACALRLPMRDHPGARSLNLATAVCAAVYEGWRVVEAAAGGESRSRPPEAR
ncbi:MAG TPA: tRNA (cytidine(34)-2'-O)-methyltransferase [Phycisphaerales bacterium]|nr:tRNA (cytidine(34)-2'-O)-methyltransferase [Phycisphaerales bacterium]HMP38134.1 tRNA (cytidine(34)-2'-O)-methyltransferase [Phycisphaerales bacterium]